MVAVGCELLLLPIAVAAACERFWACAAIACAAACRNSIKHVAGVKSRKSHGCSSDGGEIRPSLDFRSERKTKMHWSYLSEGFERPKGMMKCPAEAKTSEKHSRGHENILEHIKHWHLN